MIPLHSYLISAFALFVASIIINVKVINIKNVLNMTHTPNAITLSQSLNATMSFQK